jgi:hypothetical protein
MVAKNIGQIAMEKDMKLVDVYLNNLGKVYYNVLKGLINPTGNKNRKLTVRWLVLNKNKGHGTIRPKKARRT